MRLIGWVLVLVGLAITGYGAFEALGALVGLYQQNLSDPLNAPEGQEQGVSQAMMRGALIGAAGTSALVVGTVMVYTGSARARRRKRALQMLRA
ncbi:MAG: hypothetical protein SFZ23_01725 [Planctomycetota bacterium]|nr:hypothetical protein [Planctomycetota bacterium]